MVIGRKIMNERGKSGQRLRWILSVLVAIAGLSTTWAWGQVAQLAEPNPGDAESGETTLYAAWQPAGAAQPVLHRSSDGGASWQALALPSEASPVAWANDGDGGLALAPTDGTLFRSEDRGEHWTLVARDLPVLSMAWSQAGVLYLGTEGQGVYRLGSDDRLEQVATNEPGLAGSAIRQLALAPEGKRLFAATAETVFYSDDGGQTWVASAPVAEGITALVATSRQQIYVGTEIGGVYRSQDAGQRWMPAREGLGLAAGQMVRVTALQADPGQGDVLYVTVNHILGSTQVHASPAGAFVTLDGGGLWQPLAGPTFPQAQQATGLVVVPGEPLHVQAVTASGLQGYQPDLAGALRRLAEGDASARLSAARMLGLARAREAGTALLNALGDPDPAVSLAAARALGRIGDPETAGALLVALDHPSDQVRMGAARALGMMGAQAAVEPLRAMFLGGEGSEVLVAAEALAQIGNPEAIEALLVPMGDLSLTARRHAAMAALETMGGPAAEPLARLLDSPSAHVRHNAAEALGWSQRQAYGSTSPSAVEALARTVDKDADASVRARAAWALGEIGASEARSSLEKAASGDPASSVRAEASAALANISEEEQPAGRWLASWAPALNRLQPLRWLILALSLAGAAWLVVGGGNLQREPDQGQRRLQNSGV
jgi:HEAT repeat protein